MTDGSSLLDAALEALPSSIRVYVGPGQSARDSYNYSKSEVETILRFTSGAPLGGDGRSDEGGDWAEAQNQWRQRLQQLNPDASAPSLGKRGRDEEEAGGSGGSKKPKFEGDASGTALCTLHGVSVSAPIRKKVDIRITEDAVLLLAAGSETELVHPPLSLSSFRNAFLLPNEGKNRNKPQWSVLFLPTDPPPSNSKGKDKDVAPQLVFSLERTVPAGKSIFAVTEGSGGERVTHPKGTETLPSLSSFLTHVPSSITLSKYTSPSSNDGTLPYSSTSRLPYLETYRAAKEGSLYFLREGILWLGPGSRPVELFALGDIAPDSDDPSLGGVKTLSATGRTFSLYVRRWAVSAEDGEGEICDEVEFAMIDGRETENVMQWVRKYRRAFGVRSDSFSAGGSSELQSNGKVDKGKGKARALPVEEVKDEDESDVSDEDYVASGSDDGSASSSSDEEGGDDNGVEADEDGDDSDSGEDDAMAVDDDDDEDLTAERHPLLRPGAMPKMSKAAMDMAVAMVSGDLVPDAENEGDELDE